MLSWWTLPEAFRWIPVVVLVDEVAELFLMADKSEKDEVARTATALLRLAQLGRAFAVYLVVCGQRIGSDLGPGVTALSLRLQGRPLRGRRGGRAGTTGVRPLRAGPAVPARPYRQRTRPKRTRKPAPL